MAAGTRVMRIICNTHQRGVRMAACTLGRSYSHDRRMVRSCRMDRIPGGAVTRCTVTAGTKVFTDRRARQGTVGCMTGGTCIMGIRIPTG
jgi:hypothetical protein